MNKEEIKSLWIESKERVFDEMARDAVSFFSHSSQASGEINRLIMHAVSALVLDAESGETLYPEIRKYFMQCARERYEEELIDDGRRQLSAFLEEEGE